MKNWIIVLTLIYQYIPSLVALTNVKLGVLLMTSAPEPFDLRRIGPALDIGFEYSEKHYGIKYEVIYHNYTGFCPKHEAIGYFSELYYKDNIQAIVGPACSECIVAVGRLAQYLKIPIVSGVGDLIVRKLAEDDMYDTFTRMSYNLEKLSTSVQGIMTEYKWRHIAVIYDMEYVFFELAGSNLVREFKANSAWPRPLDLHFRASKLSDPGSLLKEASLNARFIVIFCNAELFRSFMWRAYQLGQADGDYVFLTMELFPSDWLGFYTKFQRGDEKDFGVAKAYESVLLLTIRQPNSAEYKAFASDVKQRALRDYGYKFHDEEEVNYFITAFYDGLIYFSEAYNRTVAEGGNITQGDIVARKAWNSTYPGISGTVAIDENGDRVADFDILDMTDPDGKTFKVVGSFIGSALEYQIEPNVSIHWPKGLPPDVPACGFTGNLCGNTDDSKYTTLALSLSFLAVMGIAIVVAFFVYRKVRFDMEVGKKTWLIPWNEVQMSKSETGASILSKSRMSMAISEKGESDAQAEQLFTEVGHCRGNIVAVRKLKADTIDLDKSLLIEFRQLQTLQHCNIARFIGVCMETGKKTAILVEYCPRGSLQDIIENEDINLDWTFRYSLIWDIIKGMQYLHSSCIKYHGRLTSTNCVIDSRFLLKLTDYGIPSVYQQEQEIDIKSGNINMFKYLWKAPEVLRMGLTRSRLLPALKLQKADVFGFGIILQEIVMRSAPYDGSELSASEIVERVKLGSASGKLTRPNIPNSSCSPELQLLMQLCWAEDPDDRPTFDSVSVSFKKINSGTKGNIMDNLMKRMEQYANNLESLVSERTNAYLEEKKKTEELLHRLLPPSVAKQLESGQNVLSESYECVTIYFSDIVGFTSISAGSTPMQVITLLNELYTVFDNIIDSFDVYKVETIGDAYMVVSGLPARNGDMHADQISRMALQIKQAVLKFKIRHLPEDKLRIRIGLHSGTVVAGVVGLKMPRYCLFGDTVNTASRMESTSEPLKIHISNSTKSILDTFETYEIETRGDIEVKGKGTMTTHWLLGVKDCLSDEKGKRKKTNYTASNPFIPSPKKDNSVSFL